MDIIFGSLLENHLLASCSAVAWPQAAGALNVNLTMLDLVKEAQSGSESPVLKTLPANVLHYSFDASRCAGTVIIAHTSGGWAFDLLLSLYVTLPMRIFL